jgi:uncharacterized Tic20 family protein
MTQPCIPTAETEARKGDNSMSEEPIATPAPAELTEDEKAFAGLAHALMISTWWIGPLVIFLTKRRSRFVSFRSLQALFWQIIFTLLYVAGMAVIFIAAFGTLAAVPDGKTADPPFPTALFLMFPLFG